MTSCPRLRSNWVRALPTKPVPPPRRETGRYRFGNLDCHPQACTGAPITTVSFPRYITLGPDSPAPSSHTQHPSPEGLHSPCPGATHHVLPASAGGKGRGGLTPTSAPSTLSRGLPPTPSKTTSPSQEPPHSPAGCSLPRRPGPHSGLAPSAGGPPAPTPVPAPAWPKPPTRTSAPEGQRAPRRGLRVPALTHQHPHGQADCACTKPRAHAPSHPCCGWGGRLKGQRAPAH